MFLNFGGKELTDFIKIREVKRPLLAERENYSIDINSMNGSVYTGHKYKSKTIEVDFAIVCKTSSQYFEFVRTLGDMLDTETPTKLVIGDEPDKYYYAVLDGATELDQLMSTGLGTIRFLCHNPLAYSDSHKIFEADSDGVVTVENNGSAKTQPLINIEFSKDAHFVQVVNYTSDAILIGNRVDVDKTSTKPSTVVLNEPCETTTNFTASGNVLDSGREVTGNCTINGGGYGICCANYGDGEKWHGGALRRNIGTSLEEFEIEVRVEHDSKGSVKGHGSNSNTKPSNGSKYTVTAKPSLRVRSGRGSSYKKLTSIPKGKIVTVTDISKGWGKVTYNSKTGYCDMTYLKLNSSKSARATTDEETPSAENRMGRLEVYLFDNNSQKLGKFVIRDSEQYFEYTQPEVYIGNKLVLSDGVDAPSPKTETKKDEDGNKTITKVDSGKFGNWNEFKGTFKLKRVKKGSGYLWTCEVNKQVDGKTTQRLVSNSLSDKAFPTGNLNHVVIWFGQYGDVIPVDTMTVSNIKVSRVNPVSNTTTNRAIFKQGDQLIIDCENNEIELNNNPFMSELDIGSKFFNVGKGTSQFMVVSDDDAIDVSASITEKWL